jgi:hypothetical protein
MARDRIPRREALKALAGLFAMPLTAWNGALAAATIHDRDITISAAKIIDLFSDKTSARVIGSHYLSQNPAEASVNALIEKLSVDLPGVRAGFAGQPHASLAELFAQRVRREFESGSVVRIQGWVLSVCEARLCALAALSS